MKLCESSDEILFFYSDVICCCPADNLQTMWKFYGHVVTLIINGIHWNK